MSLFVRKLLAGTVIATGAIYGTSAFAGESYDWTGFYLGGLIGGTQTKSNSDVSYDQYGATEDGTGWSDNQGFFGDIYNDIHDSSFSVYESDGGIVGSPDTDYSHDFDLGDPLDFWVNSDTIKSTDLSGTALLGGQVQSGALVLGAELRGTFGNFGTDNHNDYSITATDTGSVTCETDYDNCEVDTVVPGWEGYSNIDGADGEIISDGDVVTYDANYTQTGTMNYDTSYSSVFAPVGRIGVAADRVLLFAMGGPTVAKVKATTSATVTETGDITIAVDDADDTVLHAEQTYDWSGDNSETLYGYSVGGGLEWAMTDNVTFRLEGTYTDLGSIDVTGYSEDTDATYTVKQDLTSYAVNTGFLVKF